MDTEGHNRDTQQETKSKSALLEISILLLELELFIMPDTLIFSALLLLLV